MHWSYNVSANQELVPPGSGLFETVEVEKNSGQSRKNEHRRDGRLDFVRGKKVLIAEVVSSASGHQSFERRTRPAVKWPESAGPVRSKAVCSGRAGAQTNCNERRVDSRWPGGQDSSETQLTSSFIYREVAGLPWFRPCQGNCIRRGRPVFDPGDFGVAEMLAGDM